MHNRLPHIEKYERQSLDWIMEIAAAVGLIIVILLVVVYYGGLPDKIPTHFNANGVADDFSHKASIFGLVVMSLFVYALLFSIRFFPDKINFPVKVDQHNAAYQYKLAMRMLMVLNMILMFTFAYITYSVIMMAHQAETSLGAFFLPTSLVLIFGSIAIYLLLAMKHS